MASKSSDGWLWVSLAILGYFGSLAVHRQLVAIRQASEITRHDKRPDISQRTEDALKLKALGELTQSPNHEIRDAAVKIITDRAIREGHALNGMLIDIAGTDIERRDKALACFRFLCDPIEKNKHSDKVICRHSTFKSIVDCLCNLLPEAGAAENGSAFRTQPERDALYVLHRILIFDFPLALEAGVISRWLAQYPFGGTNASEHQKKETINNIIINEACYEDRGDFECTMRAMLYRMASTPSLRNAMIEHGLLDVPKSNDISDDWVPPGIFSRTYRTGRNVPVGTSDRPREESFEEQALRRRRREAMVLGEVGRPIERADIIERDSTALDGFRTQILASLEDESDEESEQPVAAVPDEDVEEELELLMEEITQEESLRERGWLGWLRRLRPDGLAPEP